MALSTKITTAAANAECNALVDLIDVGSGTAKVAIYDGSQPAGPATAITSQVKLAEFNLANPAFGAASSGAAAVNSTPLSTTAVATGTASWFRVIDRDGLAIIDGSVGTGTNDMVIDNASIASGQTVKINSWSITQPVA